MIISISNKPYELLIGYQQDEKRRNAFNQLVEKTYHFSFESWYQAGYWNNKYIPYTLFDEDTAVANVSVNIMRFEVLGELQFYIQIGTVMTDEAYRHLGLSRFLMEYVLLEWKGQCDLVYLFANKTVLDMYPKFGFKQVKEYAFFKTLKKVIEPICYEKLDMDNPVHREKLYHYATNSKSFAKVSMRDNPDLMMFYCTSFLKENVFYSQALNAIFIATFTDKQVQLWDVFSTDELEMNKIITLFDDIEKVRLGFTPQNTTGFDVEEIGGEDALFVQCDRTNPFDGNQLMFPLLSHA